MSFWWVPEAAEADSAPKSTLRAFGKLRHVQASQSPLWVEVAHKANEPSPIHCALTSQTDHDLLHLCPPSGPRVLEIDLVGPGRALLRLDDRHSGSYQLRNARFQISSYDYIESGRTVEAGWALVGSASLTSPGVLQLPRNRVLHERGTLEASGSDPRRITWCCGTKSYAMDYSYHATRSGIGSTRSTLISATPTIRLAHRLEQPSTLLELLEAFGEAIDAPLALLSFFARERIACYQLEILLRPADPQQRGRFAATRRRRFWPWEKSWQAEEPVLDEEELSDGTFALLLDALSRSDQRSDLLRALRYHVSSYSAHGIESQFLLAFAALETSLNATAAGRHPLPSDIHWASLEKALKSVIDQHAEEKGLSRRSSSQLKAKLRELRRPSFLDQALGQLEQLDAETMDLWELPRRIAVTQEAGLKLAKDARDALIHSTTVHDFEELETHMMRIQCLNERILLARLGLPRRLTSNTLRFLA